VIYGSPEVTSGGNALKFYASVRLDIRRKEILPDNRGIQVKVRVVKNKVAAPFQVVNLDILFGKGIDSDGCLLDAAEELGVVERKGSWYAMDGTNLAQGRMNVVELLRNDPDLNEQVASRVRHALLANKEDSKEPTLNVDVDDSDDADDDKEILPVSSTGRADSKDSFE
jgi:recombination protein RecA